MAYYPTNIYYGLDDFNNFSKYLNLSLITWYFIILTLISYIRDVWASRI